MMLDYSGACLALGIFLGLSKIEEGLVRFTNKTTDHNLPSGNLT